MLQRRLEFLFARLEAGHLGVQVLCPTIPQQQLDQHIEIPVDLAYTPTIRVALLGSWIAQQFDEAGSMTTRLKGLQDEVDETVFIAIQNGAYGQYVLAVPKESSRSMRALSGQMKLLTMSATGRVLLSMK